MCCDPNLRTNAHLLGSFEKVRMLDTTCSFVVGPPIQVLNWMTPQFHFSCKIGKTDARSKEGRKDGPGIPRSNTWCRMRNTPWRGLKRPPEEVNSSVQGRDVLFCRTWPIRRSWGWVLQTSPCWGRRTDWRVISRKIDRKSFWKTQKYTTR